MFWLAKRLRWFLHQTKKISLSSLLLKQSVTDPDKSQILVMCWCSKQLERTESPLWKKRKLNFNTWKFFLSKQHKILYERKERKVKKYVTRANQRLGENLEQGEIVTKPFSQAWQSTGHQNVKSWDLRGSGSSVILGKAWFTRIAFLMKLMWMKT